MHIADGNQPDPMETSKQSSLKLDLVSQVMYIRNGEVNPGDEAKVERLESKMSDWKRYVIGDSKNFTRDEISFDLHQVEKNFDGYWCEGDKCACKRTHWVIHESESNCWECMHDPCACNPPLELDQAEKAYFRFFLSCDGKTKTNIWLTRPTSDVATINYKRGEKKRKDRREKEKEEENYAQDQEYAQNHGSAATNMPRWLRKNMRGTRSRLVDRRRRKTNSLMKKSSAFIVTKILASSRKLR
jgi:hypothetical protein